MEPILNREEIAELLKAIKEGKIPVDAAPVQQDRFLECQEIDLFNISHRQSEESRFPNFDLIIDHFCRNFSVSLTNELQRSFLVNRVSIEAMEFQEYTATLKNPGAIGILNLPPLKQGALLIANPVLSFALIELMLGASSEHEPKPPQRSLTTLELTIIKPLLALACACLDKAFRPLSTIETTLHKIESNPRLVSITDPDAEVLVCSLTVDIKGIRGEIALVIPVTTLSPVREKLKSLLNFHELTQGSWGRILERSVQGIPTRLTAQSGTLNLTVGQILDLKQGDILPLDYDPQTPLRILVGNTLKFFAKPGVSKGKKAISITGVYDA